MTLGGQTARRTPGSLSKMSQPRSRILDRWVRRASPMRYSASTIAPVRAATPTAWATSLSDSAPTASPVPREPFAAPSCVFPTASPAFRLRRLCVATPRARAFSPTKSRAARTLCVWRANAAPRSALSTTPDAAVARHSAACVWAPNGPPWTCARLASPAAGSVPGRRQPTVARPARRAWSGHWSQSSASPTRVVSVGSACLESANPGSLRASARRHRPQLGWLSAHRSAARGRYNRSPVPREPRIRLRPACIACPTATSSTVSKCRPELT
jgi:hypothetical protein